MSGVECDSVPSKSSKSIPSRSLFGGSTPSRVKSVECDSVPAKTRIRRECPRSNIEVPISKDDERPRRFSNFLSMKNEFGHVYYERSAPLRDRTVTALDDPVYYNMTRYLDRLRTFSHWPNSVYATPNEFAECGLFYTGYDDILKCYSCGGGMRDWLTTDNPWYEHAKLYPKCPFVLDRMGHKFVRNVLHSTGTIMRCSTKFDNETDLREDLIGGCTYV